jgi:hypothetical protein
MRTDRHDLQTYPHLHIELLLLLRIFGLKVCKNQILPAYATCLVHYTSFIGPSFFLKKNLLVLKVQSIYINRLFTTVPDTSLYETSNLH